MGFVNRIIHCGAKIRLKEFMTSMLFMTLMKSCECASHVNDSLVVDEISFEVIYETVNSDLDARKLSVNTSGLTSDGPFLITSLPVVSSPCEGINASASTDNSTTWPAAPIRYSVLFASVAATLSAIIFVFGLLGNILVVIVIARTRSMHTTTNCYLLSLAVADSLVLLSATLPSIPEPFFRVDEWPYGRTMCPILVFIQYLGVDSSSLSITALTIERYIAICHPMKAQTTCTVSRAKKIIVILWVFTLLYCSPWLGLTVIKRKPVGENEFMDVCNFRLARSSYVVLYMIDLIVFYVIPLLIATVLYLLIWRILYLSRAMRKNDNSKERRSPKRRADSRVQVVRMLVVVVVTFASLWMPYRVMVVYNSFASTPYHDMWFLLFARTMIYVNCAINPVLYNILSDKFKRAFRNLLNCCPRRESVPSTNYSGIATDIWVTRKKRVSLQQSTLNSQQLIKQQHRLFQRSSGKRNGYENGSVNPIHCGSGVGSGANGVSSSHEISISPMLHRIQSIRSVETAEEAV